MALVEGAEEPGQPGLTQALTDLINVSQTPARQRTTSGADPVDEVCSDGYQHGLQDEALNALIDVVTRPNTLSQAGLAKLVRHLYPAGQVSDEVVFKVVGCLGLGVDKPAPPVQAALLRWLILVYDVLADPSLLSRVYAVLFNGLDTLSLCAPLCHLLALVTRRKHVRPYRIQALLELRRKMGREPHLLGLIRVYKDYYPDIIVGETAAGKASCFSHPNPEWRDRLVAIQEAQASSLPDHERTQGAFKVARRGAKRSKVAVIPDVHTSRANEKSVTLEEVENVDNFIEKLDLVELPNQAISVLHDPLLQKLLTLRPSDVATQRLERWLSSFFEEELQAAESEDRDASPLQSILRGVLDYTRYTKTLPPACGRFLQAYLGTWNGYDHRGLIMDLATYVPMASFEELLAAFFQPIEVAILTEHVASKVALLEYYTTVLGHWTVCLLASPMPPRSLLTTSAMTSYDSVIRRADTLCLTILEGTWAPPLTVISPILSFYEVVVDAVAHSRYDGRLRINIPSALLTYRLCFTTSLSCMSRLCAILAKYKRAFDDTAKTEHKEVAYPRETLTHFNGYLLDVCNCIWRNRAFNRDDLGAMGCLVPDASLPRLRAYVDGLGYVLPTILGLSYSPIFCALSITCFRELEDAAADDISIRHAGPLTQHSLARLKEDDGLDVRWADYRRAVLRWLEARGVRGVSNLLYITMKDLMPSK
ncbi:MAG: hypothetical protein M1838_004894 [Thelocarpon superellum]|nr:MAG: hypothetical protein M1838_004894 [Thelocarpon superellum]